MLNIPATCAHLLNRKELPRERVNSILGALITGQLGDIEAAALLTAWRAKGETASELAAAASVLAESMIRLESNLENLIDTCGTGGDGTGTFNISTATALVVAGVGVPVAKHGNRAVTSRSGASDALAALGVRLQPGPFGHAVRSKTLDWPFVTHRSFIRLWACRAFEKTLGRAHDLQLPGPIGQSSWGCLPGGGGGACELLEPMSGALARLWIEHAWVVIGEDGLDEVTLTGTTLVRQVRQGRVSELTLDPQDFGLPKCKLEDLAAGGPDESAAIIRSVLEGAEGPCSNIVLANAAAALLVVGRARDLPEGVGLARQSIRSGQAGRVLEKLRTT